MMLGKPLERRQVGRVAMVGQHDVGIPLDRVRLGLEDIATGHRLACGVNPPR